MGQEIVYCFSCQTRLMASDFERGKAVHFEDRVACAGCAKGYLASLPPGERPKPVVRTPDSPLSSHTPRRGSRIPSGATPRPGSLQVVPPETDKKSKLPVVLGVGALVVGILVLVVLMSGGEKPPEGIAPPQPARTAPPKPKLEPAKPSAEIVRALEALTLAQNLPATSTLDARIKAWDEAVRLASGTPYHSKAVEAYNALIEQRRKALDAEYEALVKRVGPLLAAGSFGKAREQLASARGEHALSEWTSRIDEKISGIDSEIDRIYPTLEQQASAAKATGDLETVKKVRAQVAAWGIAGIVKELDAVLASVEMAKPESKELPAYRAAWTKALPRVAAGEFEAALAELEAASKKLTEEEVRKEAAADLKDLARIPAARAAGLKRAAAVPAGTTVTLYVRDEKGAIQPRTGVVSRSGPARLRLVDAEGRGVFVELEDLTGAGLASIPAKDLPADERRALAIACLIEGNETAARQVLEGTSLRVPAKYGEYARGAKVTLPPVDARELEARALFYAAEREFSKAESRLEAVKKYVALKAEHAGTRLVAGARDRIDARAATGKEYFYTAGELKGNGTFQQAKQEDGKLWWLNARETQPSLENHVAVEFAAMPGRVYKCWVYAGACCQETFVVDYQATGMTGPDPERRTRKVPIDPGSEYAASVRHGVRYLKKTHQDHGGPKHPARWAWIPLKLPTEPAPGAAGIRVISNQKGFAVSAVCISSERTSPPSEKELEEELAKEKDRPDPEIVTEGLVGHWKFDDGSGTTALDSVNAAQTGQLHGDPEWVEGVHGGALRFDGDGDYVELPDVPGLRDLQEESYSITAWFKPEITPPGTGNESNAAYAIAVKSGNHSGLNYSFENHFVMTHWLTTGNTSAGSWNDKFPPGVYYHLAGVVDRKGGKTHLYVNGKRIITNTWDEPGAATREYGSTTWKIGTGHPNAELWAWPANGWIDDVRFYNRAVKEEEIRLLYTAGLDARSNK